MSDETEGQPTRRAVLAAVAGLAAAGSAVELDAERAPAHRREERPEGADELAAFVRANRRRLEELGLGEGALPVREERDEVRE